VPKRARGEVVEQLRRELEAILDRMNLELDIELGIAEQSDFTSSEQRAPSERREGRSQGEGLG
jgi:hypothetical protein